MNIIIYTKHSRTPGSFRLHGWQLALLLSLLLVVVPGTALYVGTLMGEHQVRSHLLPGEWKQEMEQNRVEIAQAARKAREEMNALALRLAQLQAQAIRLNALGQRLVEIGKLDEGEFDFSRPPGVGGPLGDTALSHEIDMPDFIRSLDQLAFELDDREQRLLALETFFMNRNLVLDVVPAGRPVRSGWMSSGFGSRTDPFSGAREYHRGLDFAGKEGTEIHAVAAGVVTWSGDRYTYGNMVEINHGNGYITRYAHNKKNLVKAGDVVERGQVIALMGMTGRSTAPHVHFEVIKNGRTVDPARYIRAAR
jgi:murein DD-endopeptidase MepM/ murein hydrolase activator NlpD